MLQMAATEEKRERIKWYHARRAAFEGDDNWLPYAVQLAEQSQHEDARFLVSLFLGEVPEDDKEVVKVFMTRDDDPRCMCWAVLFGAKHELQLRSAEGGYAYAQAMHARSLEDGVQAVAWLEKAVSQGEPLAMALLADCLWNGSDVECNRPRAEVLWREAALLGLSWAQRNVAEHCCAPHSAGWAVWMRRAAVQGDEDAREALYNSILVGLDRYDHDESGRLVFEIGFALTRDSDWESQVDQGDVRAFKRALKLLRSCCSEAERGIMCWLWLSRKANVAKDVRIKVADLIWQERAAWSERPKSALKSGSRRKPGRCTVS